ncbi:hypothetical protein MKEN_01415700 [Mycena kentingensis (nom. inval.)]|nr:hypothetical protein MKEN_01415700 [Mycena kentingensis (nom. inval.)]
MFKLILAAALASVALAAPAELTERATCEVGPNVRICTDVNFGGTCVDLNNSRNQWQAIPTEFLGTVSSIRPFSCGNGEDCLAGFADGSFNLMFSAGFPNLATLGKDNQLTQFRCDW